MALAQGTRLGPYEILSALGAGGMGEVYRARDHKLGRDVAIKVLPDSLARNPERLARFEREARTLAALNHPNIAHIHGFEDSTGIPALVMELVEGPTLADRIAKGPIPIDEALPVAKQIAEALEAAHEQGIIHRDLKPANIKVKDDGTVKVLDFGLAKALATPAASNSSVTQSPTITPPTLMTGAGMILGTAAYMSPEQARGLAVGKRADIWSYGCVLYEMLTGMRAFPGETVTDVLAAVLTKDPAWHALPPATPAKARDIVRRCLQKDPRRRQRDIGDVSVELDEVSQIEAPTRPRGERLAWLVAAVLAVVAAALAGKAILAGRNDDASDSRPMRLELSTPPSRDPESFALSPDGTTLAFVATVEGVSRLWVRPLDQPVAHELRSTDGATQPFWSPNSRTIGFFAERKLKRIDVDGGASKVLADAPVSRGGAWSREGVIVFAPSTPGGLVRVPADGGTVTPVTTPVAGGAPSHRWPEFLPDGRRFLFFGALGAAESRGIYIGTLTGEPAARVVDADSAAAFAPPDRLLIVRGVGLIAVPFNPGSGTVVGDAEPIADGVSSQVRGGAFSVSQTGVLAYRPGMPDRRRLVWINRAGETVAALGEIDLDGLASPELAPDGRRAIAQRFVNGNVGLWLIDADRGVPTRLTVDRAVNAHAVWSRDSRRIVYTSNRDGRMGLFDRDVDGSGGERAVMTAGAGPIATDWSPDGRFVLYSSQSASGNGDLWAQPVAGGPPIAVVQAPFDESGGQFSPNGRWIAYQSDASGRVEIYVRRFPPVGEPLQVSSNGGRQPRWRRDGGELFYVGPDSRLYAVSVSGDDQLKLGEPRALFAARFAYGSNIIVERAQYAVSSDGRFLANVSVGDAATPPINIILNWHPASKK